MSNLLRVSSGKALTLSGILHFGALVLLAQSWIAATVEVPRLAGSRQAAIQLEANFREASLVEPVVVPAVAVDVTPHVANVFNRRFVETSSVDIDWEIDAIVHAARLVPDAAGAPTVARAAPDRPATRPPRPVELPRAKLDRRPPQTSIVVPPIVETSGTSPPEYDFIPPPRYPELARQRGWQGTVLLAVKIDATGGVTRVEVEESSGYQLLDAAAVNAVKRWRYKPAVGREGPVATQELQPVTFRLPRR